MQTVPKAISVNDGDTDSNSNEIADVPKAKPASNLRQASQVVDKVETEEVDSDNEKVTIEEAESDIKVEAINEESEEVESENIATIPSEDEKNDSSSSTESSSANTDTDSEESISTIPNTTGDSVTESIVTLIPVAIPTSAPTIDNSYMPTDSLSSPSSFGLDYPKLSSSNVHSGTLPPIRVASSFSDESSVPSNAIYLVVGFLALIIAVVTVYMRRTRKMEADKTRIASSMVYSRLNADENEFNFDEVDSVLSKPPRHRFRL